MESKKYPVFHQSSSAVRRCAESTKERAKNLAQNVSNLGGKIDQKVREKSKATAEQARECMTNPKEKVYEFKRFVEHWSLFSCTLRRYCAGVWRG